MSLLLWWQTSWRRHREPRHIPSRRGAKSFLNVLKMRFNGHDFGDKNQHVTYTSWKVFIWSLFFWAHGYSNDHDDPIFAIPLQFVPCEPLSATLVVMALLLWGLGPTHFSFLVLQTMTTTFITTRLKGPPLGLRRRPPRRWPRGWYW